ncbi:hypothetical protein PMAC_001936 [Pneumocystis sp. 'macacae']|nr:hypothetical protein PMAC_001936 [Pneumocystis sp. 'macacae']
MARSGAVSRYFTSVEQLSMGNRNRSVSSGGYCAGFFQDICVQMDPKDAVLFTNGAWQHSCCSLYALDLAAGTLYSILDACWRLQLSIEEMLSAQSMNNKGLFGAHNTGKTCSKRIIWHLRELYARISSSAATKSLLLRTLCRVLDARSLQYAILCSMGGSETGAFLALLMGFFEPNCNACDILVGAAGRVILRELILCTEKMYEEEENFEELQRFFFQLIECGRIAEMFGSIDGCVERMETRNMQRNVGNAEENTDYGTNYIRNSRGVDVNYCQLVFLKLVNTYLSYCGNAPNNHDNTLSIHRNSLSSQGNIRILRSIGEFVAWLLSKMCSRTSVALTRYTWAEDIQQAIDEIKKNSKATEILISCALYVSKGEVKEVLLKNDVIRNLLGVSDLYDVPKLLRVLDMMRLRDKKSTQEHRNARNCLDRIKLPYFKRDIVQLLSTLCYKDKRVQDKIRELSGLELILSQCNIDEENPYLREYAIFCLRNVLEDNEENKKILRELRPIGVENSEMIAGFGLEFEMNEGCIQLKHNKLKVEKKLENNNA